MRVFSTYADKPCRKMLFFAEFLLSNKIEQYIGFLSHSFPCDMLGTYFRAWMNLD